jgi:Cu-Zn family superoxide dismutase
MMTKRFLVSITVTLFFIRSAIAAGSKQVEATFINARNERIGTATLTQTPNGVLIDAKVSALPSGEHGFHIHETGICDSQSGFKSAGGHYAPRGHEHGYETEKGPHAGDMPNQLVGAEGMLRAQVVNANVTLDGGKATLFDSDGSVLVIHADPDDYESQPSGDAGSRLACAVMEM